LKIHRRGAKKCGLVRMGREKKRLKGGWETGTKYWLMVPIKKGRGLQVGTGGGEGRCPSIP